MSANADRFRQNPRDPAAPFLRRRGHGSGKDARRRPEPHHVGTLVPGASIGLHTHETNSEIVYILRGTGTAWIDGETELLRPGVCHYCPKGHRHGMINDGTEDLVLFTVVPEHEPTQN